jgi:pilus assembly protein CpaE
VLNSVNTPKRPEISVKEFEQALDLPCVAVVEFDSETFGQAANNGQMIEEMSPKAKSVMAFRDIALALAHRKEVRVEKKSGLAPFLEKLKLKR